MTPPSEEGGETHCSRPGATHSARVNADAPTLDAAQALARRLALAYLLLVFGGLLLGQARLKGARGHTLRPVAGPGLGGAHRL